MGSKIISATSTINSQNSINNAGATEGWIDRIASGEVKADIAALWANMHTRINHEVVCGAITVVTVVPIVLYLSYRIVTAAIHYFRKPAAPFVDNPQMPKASLVKEPPVTRTQASSSVSSGLVSSDPIKAAMPDFSENIQSIIDKLNQKFTLTQNKQYERDPKEKINKKPKKFIEIELSNIVDELSIMKESIGKLDQKMPNVEAIFVKMDQACKMLIAKNVSMTHMVNVRKIITATKEILCEMLILLNEQKTESTKLKETRSQKRLSDYLLETPVSENQQNLAAEITQDLKKRVSNIRQALQETLNIEENTPAIEAKIVAIDLGLSSFRLRIRMVSDKNDSLMKLINTALDSAQASSMKGKKGEDLQRAINQAISNLDSLTQVQGISMKEGAGSSTVTVRKVVPLQALAELLLSDSKMTK